MPNNRGKQFEGVIREAFTKVPNTHVIRIPDQTNGFRGAANICDFIVYHYPYQYCIECKSVHGNTLPFSNIKAQWDKLLEACKIKGVIAGVICWWVDKDKTKFIPIQTLQGLKQAGYKSLRYDAGILDYMLSDIESYHISTIRGKKKRVFFDYDMTAFFEEVECGKED